MSDDDIRNQVIDDMDNPNIMIRNGAIGYYQSHYMTEEERNKVQNEPERKIPPVVIGYGVTIVLVVLLLFAIKFAI